MDQVQRFARGGGLRIAEAGGAPVGALVLGSAPGSAPAATRPELYILLALSSRRHAGQQIGMRLVGHAVRDARQHGCAQLRVDGWAAAPSLVGWHERRGFRRSGTFDVNRWRGQILTLQADGGSP